MTIDRWNAAFRTLFNFLFRRLFIPVVHLKRPVGTNKSFNRGDEVELTDLRGSQALEGLSWNVIALERDQQDRDKCDLSKIRLLKNREWGFLGVCDTLQYNHQTGRLKAPPLYEL